MADRFKAALPYVIVLGIAAVLWVLVGTVTYDARPGQLGPDVWPRAAIALMGLASLFEIVRIVSASQPWSDTGGLTEAFDRSQLEADASEPVARRPLMLVAGIVLTLGYAVLVTTFGFILSTFLYLVIFTYVGGYRNHLVIWLCSALGTLAFAFVFIRFAYVSVPRGTQPFDAVTHAVLHLLGGQ